MYTEGITLSVHKFDTSTHIWISRPKRDKPFDGVVIQKRPANDYNAEEAEQLCDAKHEFLAHLGEPESNDRKQEQRTFLFKFADDIEKDQRKKLAWLYFKLIIEPETFPKGHVNFVKKCALLVYQLSQIIQLYIVIKDVPRTFKPLPQKKKRTQSKNDKPVENYITVLTPAVYDYQCMPEVPVHNKTALSFLVRAKSDAHVALSSVYGDTLRNTYEIIIGDQDNTRCTVKYNGRGQVMTSAPCPDVLDEWESRDIWISWRDNQLIIGRGDEQGKDTILKWHIPRDKRHKVNCLSVSTAASSTGEWQFVELLGDTMKTTLNMAEKKRLMRESLLREAKQQIIIQQLERAYPECITTINLMKLTRIQQQSRINAFLQSLLAKNAIRQVATGVWLRSPALKNGHKQDVQMVSAMPRLRDTSKPTIAIVTSLYCTTLAVEHMMEEKVTYIKYKAGIGKGESTVYTLGTIGDNKVVSLKLSGLETGRQCKIATGNAITRLMGTFDSIRHMLLVGVGGGVPNLSDFHQHVRQGDVVVSSPAVPDGPSYVQCKKRGKIHDNNTWKSSDPMLMNYVRHLWKNYQSNARTRAPWDQYIAQGMKQLSDDQLSFKRPDNYQHQIYAMVDDTIELVQQPHPPMGRTRLYPANQTRIRYAVNASGINVAKNIITRTKFAKEHGISGYDCGVGNVLDSIVGSRCGSFLIINGIADYEDGSKNTEWQPYAALAAAAYMKTLVQSYKPKNNDKS